MKVLDTLSSRQFAPHGALVKPGELTGRQIHLVDLTMITMQKFKSQLKKQRDLLRRLNTQKTSKKKKLSTKSRRTISPDHFHSQGLYIILGNYELQQAN